ncbi:MAG TPA: hypothetical protein VNB50_05055 [Gaiellaceae bacterium]|jgi:glucose/arabinose dehydrogenase|nr:hypothetical protein [Gaiellaceae bacterium]
MRLVGLALVVPIVCAFGASGSGRVHVSVAGKRPAAVLGKPWTARLGVRPASFRGPVVVTASGSKRIRARATRRRGKYRVRLVFPSAGRWRLTARAGGTTSRLGTVRVAPAPVLFAEPTSIDLEPAGTLLVVENNPGRLLRVDPRDGRVSVLAPTLTRPYAAVRAPSGAIFVSFGSNIQRIDPGGAHTTVVSLSEDIGPLAVSAAGDLYFATATTVDRLRASTLTPLAGGFSNPHGLAIAADGAVLVSDTGHQRIARVGGGVVTTFAQIGQPDGLDVAADGSVYVVDEEEDRVVHLGVSGSRIGFVGPVFSTPYDVEAAPGGVAYVLEAGSPGRIRRVGADGTVTTVSRRR